MSKHQKFYSVAVMIIFMFLIITEGQTEILIDTIAGNGLSGYNCEGRHANDASFNNPMSIGLDTDGNIYIADTRNHRVRIIDKENAVHTVAGTGVPGSSIGIVRIYLSKLYYPTGVAVETLYHTSGIQRPERKNKVRIYIADSMNHNILMVNTSGIIQPIAGSGKHGDISDNCLAIRARLNRPSEVSIDTYGNVYFTDTFNHKIRVIYNPNDSPDPGPITCAPHIKNPKNGFLYTIAGTGQMGYGGEGSPAISAQLNHPWDLQVINGEIYFTDKNNHVIRRIDKNGIISTIAGIPMKKGYCGDVKNADEELLNNPSGLWVNNGNIYFADRLNNRVRKINIDTKKIMTLAGNGEFGFGGDSTDANTCWLAHPVDVVGDNAGNLYIVDQKNSRIRLIKNINQYDSKIISDNTH